MGREGSADEAHRRRAGAVAPETLDPGLDYLRTIGQAEVVVGREHEHLAAPLHLDERPLRRADGVEPLVRARFPERIQLGAKPIVEDGAHGCRHLPPSTATRSRAGSSAAAEGAARPPG